MIQMSDQDKFWLIGWLEGEGSFVCGPPCSPNTPSVVGCSTDEDVVMRAASLLGVTHYEAKRKSKNPKHKKCWAFRKRGFDAVEFMKEIKQYMSVRRQSQIDRVIESYIPNQRKLITEDQVRQIRVLCQTNMRQQDIAEQFGLCREIINKIHRKKLHASVN